MTFQVAVRAAASNTPVRGVHVVLSGTPELGELVVRRAAFTNVTTPANNVTSNGAGLYADPLPFPNETLVFPEGGDTVLPSAPAVFWLTLPIPAHTSSGVHVGKLDIGSSFSVDLASA